MPDPRVTVSCRTRSNTAENYLYGDGTRPCPLPIDGKLPTRQDVDLALQDILKDIPEPRINRASDIEEALQDMASQIVRLWSSLTDIKLQETREIVRKLQYLQDDRRNALRSRNKNLKSLPKVTNTFRLRKSQLFDISSTLQPLPRSDREFYQDQMHSRALSRQFKTVPGLNAEANGDGGDDRYSLAEILSDESSSSSESSLSLNLEPEDPDEVLIQKATKKTISPQLLEAAERFQMSNSALASVHNTFNPNSTYTKDGVRRFRKRARQEAGKPDFSQYKIIGLGFDERKDQSFVASRIDSNRRQVEEHCSVILYTSDGERLFAGNYTPQDGTAGSLAIGLEEFCEERNIDLDNLTAVISDGCPKMLGHVGGAHHFFEILMGRPLQRCLCFFHHLELSFKSIWKFHQWATSGPGSCKEPWNLLVSGDIHTLPPANFETIPDAATLDIIQGMDMSDMSTDHQIFVGLAKVIITGELNRVISQKIGPMVLSRFTTSQVRVMRSYISHPDPPPFLRRMVEYLIHVFAPIFLYSKLFQQEYFMGPKLLLLEVMLSRKFLTTAEFTHYRGSLDNSSAMAHPENILYSMLCSKEYKERKFAVDTIKRIREREPPIDIRQFKPADYSVNEKASDLQSLCRVMVSPNILDQVTEPPATLHMTDEEIESVLYLPVQSVFPISSRETALFR